MTASNPRLVYCSLPGFASDDPRAGVPAWEGSLSALLAGYLPFKDHWNHSAFNPGDVADPDRPLFNALPIASSIGGMLGASTIVAALIARERTGEGQRIEIPLYDAMLEAIGGFITRGAGGPAGPGRGLRLPGETRLCARTAATSTPWRTRASSNGCSTTSVHWTRSLPRVSSTSTP